MGAVRLSSVNRDLSTLWTVGRLGAADDTELVGRFLEGDALSETAFRILVERHGAMVLGVCRRVLGDGHDAQDAAQAVFLVLARKAGTIRRGSVAAWLYGVSIRVAARARGRIGTRKNTEARTFAAVAKSEFAVSSAEELIDSDVIHEEVARLSEKYRTPVVLCYLEGLTYEEAAHRVGCPVGTIRIRLSRARDQLRERLSRKGFGPAAALPASADALQAFFVRQSVSIPVGWVDSTVGSAQSFLTGSATAKAAGAISASTLILTQGVLRSMFLNKLTFLAGGILGLGLLAAGGSAILGQEPGNAGSGAAAKATAPTKQQLGESAEAKRLQGLAEKRRLAERIRSRSLERLKTQLAFYEEGKITIDRMISAYQNVRDAESLVAETPEESETAFKNHQEMLTALVKREESEFEVGRGSQADLNEALEALDKANYDLDEARQGEGKGHELSIVRLERRITAIETKLDKILHAIEAGKNVEAAK